MRILDDLRAASGEPRAEVRPLVAGEPQRVRRYRRIRPADHLELEIGDDALEGHRRVVEKVAGAVATRLLAAEPGEDDRSLRAAAAGQRLRQLQHRHRPGCVVVRTVEDVVSRGVVCRRPAPEMVQVSAEQQDFGGAALVAAGRSSRSRSRCV